LCVKQFLLVDLFSAVLGHSGYAGAFLAVGR
jgi:uncharacterized membrane protein YtjA (UPF0391 family)